MANRARMRVLPALALVVGMGACSEYPTRPTEHRPVVSSVVVFPSIIGQGDSVIITVFATDRDGDTLVYDWFTDSRLIIQDDGLEDGILYNTVSSSHVFYRSTSPPRNDSVWVWCDARDRRGGSDGRRVLVLLRD